MIIADKKFLAEIDEKADALKKKILESKDEVSYSGTAYYVSNKGDDKNDGLSPENAVQSIERVYSLPLKEGDAVLFERGGLWRGEVCVYQRNITYAAYGSGPKPRFYGSYKNYAVPHEWVKTDLPNVWKYVKPFDIDIGHIVCNGSIHCIKKCHGHYGFKGSAEELKSDLEFWCDRENANTLYFYSEQNPGARFFEMEFHRRTSLFCVNGKDGTRIDNLCIMYVGVHGIASGTVNGLHVTNCEIGFIGGGIQYTRPDGVDVRLGNGVEIYGLCKDYRVENCYIHDCYDAGVTHQKSDNTETPVIMEDVTYKDNLFERCIYSIEYFCDCLSPDDVMRHIRMTGNICRFAGGFGWQRPNRHARHIQGGWLNFPRKYPSEDYMVEGNIFDRSKDTLLSVSALKEEHLPIMRGNTYIQYAGGNYGANFVPYDHYKPFDEQIESFIKEERGEKDAVIAIVPEYDGLCD